MYKEVEIDARVRVSPVQVSHTFKLKMGVTDKRNVELVIAPKVTLVIDKNDLLEALDAHPKIIEKEVKS